MAIAIVILVVVVLGLGLWLLIHPDSFVKYAIPTWWGAGKLLTIIIVIGAIIGFFWGLGEFIDWFNALEH